jgi:hypothetical protein
MLAFVATKKKIVAQGKKTIEFQCQFPPRFCLFNRVSWVLLSKGSSKSLKINKNLTKVQHRFSSIFFITYLGVSQPGKKRKHQQMYLTLSAFLASDPPALMAVSNLLFCRPLATSGAAHGLGH